MRRVKSVDVLREKTMTELFRQRDDGKYDFAEMSKGKVTCRCSWQHCGQRDLVRYSWSRLGKTVSVRDLSETDF